MEYTNKFETKQAITELSFAGNEYAIEYIATSPIDGIVDNVNAYISKKVDGSKVTVGYATYADSVVSVRFTSSEATISVIDQEALSSQFYKDLQSLIEGSN